MTEPEPEENLPPEGEEEGSNASEKARNKEKDDNPATGDLSEYAPQQSTFESPAVQRDVRLY